MTDQRSPLVIAAFEGWNDAGGAASDVLALLASAWDARPVTHLDPEDFYDFQVNRPVIGPAEDESDGEDRGEPHGDVGNLGSGGRTLTWPSTRVSVARTPQGRTVLLVQGIEPSMRWRQFSTEILQAVEPWQPSTFIGVGALLADVPHTRPIPVQSTSEDPQLRRELGLEESEYTGPVGIISVLGHLAREAGMGTLSVWAAVPHYVAQPPSPKATLALLSAIEEVVGEAPSPGDLVEDAHAWQRGVDELAQEDPEISEYVRQLEEAKDTAELPEASGEAIAREFERYLRRRDPGR